MTKVNSVTNNEGFPYSLLLLVYKCCVCRLTSAFREATCCCEHVCECKCVCACVCVKEGRLCKSLCFPVTAGSTDLFRGSVLTLQLSWFASVTVTDYCLIRCSVHHGWGSTPEQSSKKADFSKIVNLFLYESQKCTWEWNVSIKWSQSHMENWMWLFLTTRRKSLI